MKVPPKLAKRFVALSKLAMDLAAKLRELPSNLGEPVALSLAAAAQDATPLMTSVEALYAAHDDAETELAASKRAVLFFARFLRELLPPIDRNSAALDDLLSQSDSEGFARCVAERSAAIGAPLARFVTILATLRSRLAHQTAATQRAREARDGASRKLMLTLARQEGNVCQARSLLKLNNVRLAPRRVRVPRKAVAPTPHQGANVDGGIVAA